MAEQLPPLISDAELAAEFPAVDYNSVVDWLTGLSQEDYDKVGRVVSIYRKAQGEAAEVLGVPNEPSTFINPPEPAADPDDDIAIAFLEDEAPTTSKPKKGRKVTVKSDS